MKVLLCFIVAVLLTGCSKSNSVPLRIPAGALPALHFYAADEVTEHHFMVIVAKAAVTDDNAELQRTAQS